MLQLNLTAVYDNFTLSASLDPLIILLFLLLSREQHGDVALCHLSFLSTMQIIGEMSYPYTSSSFFSSPSTLIDFSAASASLTI